MRLINCSTLQLEEFFGSNISPYAILSHTWGDEEVSFADISSGRGSTRSGYRKIKYTCEQAIDDGFKYAWVDTCCIDKSSSPELSEAINSMFNWYRKSDICYVYLSDVLDAGLEEDFPESRWFTRGWTLQELLAPEDVTFYNSKWVYLGTKTEHARWISAITGIDKKALFPRRYNLDHGDLSPFCVAQRMSWASKRQTTREEDIAYCLLGIFDINMPLLYGEGHHAFLRLQEEIIRKTDDDSILAWGLEPRLQDEIFWKPDEPRNKMNQISKEIVDALRGGVTSPLFVGDLLARSARDFVDCGNLEYNATSASPFTLTNTGLQIQLPLVAVSHLNGDTDSSDVYGWIGLLGCSTASSLEFLGILLCPEADDNLSRKVARTRIIYYGSSFSHTFRISTRMAARSVLENVTITALGGRKSVESVRRFNRGHRQVLVNVSQAVKDLYIKVESGTAWNIAEEIHGYHQEWDAGATILTIKGEKRFQDIFQFRFTNDHGVKFSVFMRTISSRTIVRTGHEFSGSERFRFYRGLEQTSSQYDKEKCWINNFQGQSLVVRAEVQAKRVYDHRLFELNVDAGGIL
ncbi:hypothetical protein CUC08_Gglean003621 [Alternaria sp. MG1]|nr:hypothetical protein CUC08_Gglean003621 [Alternaria sp. MG1]